MSIRKDYIERLIEQFAAALVRLLAARREKRYDDAARLLRATALDTLGMEYEALLMVDASSTARLLGEPSRVKVLARLVAEDGDLHEAQDAPETAASRFRYALALYAQAQAMGAALEDDDTTVLTRLRSRLDSSAPT
ncbi:hypothetical protein MYSTI_00095 [Myxococcus stipitatus DSM 14675]|uniref:Uncharacterized protein n=1 Tax=Myxococcus stipitatus (strain DSM 14675 / JCM 12634 / Mx s8) TaxID=1278073 RepID=L7U4N8_MYXSD|nr:hypothetical protein [Myxococcus stipitatus]AGC41454.1 hypothetical protein MYSTI_00095 [Myxococcus stipitatus DSM 14675]